MNKTKSPWELKSTKNVYENPWIEVREDSIVRPDGKEGIYGVINSKSNGLRVIPVTEKDRIIMNYEYRYAANKPGYEFTAGGIKPGDTALDTAKRELLEETGLIANKWTELGKVNAWPSALELEETIFIAQNISGEIHNNGLEGDEGILHTKAFKLDEIYEMIKSGEIYCAASIAALMHFVIHKGTL